jgi:hypothetical protein
MPTEKNTSTLRQVADKIKPTFHRKKKEFLSHIKQDRNKINDPPEIPKICGGMKCSGDLLGLFFCLVT